MGRNGPLPHFQVLLRVEEHRFLELLRVRQEKVDREGAPVIEHLCGPVKQRTFAAIGSPFVSLGEVEEQLCRSPGLAHRYPQSPSSRLYALPRCFDEAVAHPLACFPENLAAQPATMVIRSRLSSSAGSWRDC
jgi:hypothetical protein